MNSVLRLPSSPHAAFGRLDAQIVAKDKPYTLNIANRLWPMKGLDFYPAFISTVKSHYGAEAQALEYGKDPEGSRAAINDWVEDKTAKKIKDLIPPKILNADTRMVLTNAIYFKGFWETAFKKSSTRKADFFPASGSPVQVDMMAQTGNFGYGESDRLQVVELPYKGNEVSLVVLLPEKGTALGKTEEKLSPEQIDRWLAVLRPRKVEVFLPRFTSRFKAELNQPLINLGMPTAFNAKKADFGAMRAENDLFLSKVIHEAFIAVDEEGTEAAAATAVVTAKRMVSLESPPVFRADRPFLYFIRHRPTGVILFLGRMARPKN
jgi:serpin B